MTASNLYKFKVANTIIFYKYYSLNGDIKKLNICIYGTYGVFVNHDYQISQSKSKENHDSVFGKRVTMTSTMEVGEIIDILF